ncbi:hypothetical protein [Aureibaculum sp. 2210JD6-5]|uniref:galactose-binding domain-containing protein n=1 Tax=Aureibaculum sp. 2210JD6-5 TaxID=3103957 RepID=UPI0039F219DB
MLLFDNVEFDKNIDNIVELTLAENPENFERIETWKAEPISKKEFDVSASTFIKAKNKPQVIYNTKGNVFSEGIHLKSWWEPAKDDINPSLTLDFKSPKKVKTILLSENMRSHCVRNFTIETKDATGNWETCYQGKTIGEGLRIKLNGNSIYGVRLKILKNTKAIQITAFNAYE